ncbi:MAG: DNA recombination protein RmuC, partial [Phycisphaerales bacterium]
STLSEQIKVFAGHSEQLRSETGKLARALSRPEVRGRYGEIQLRRVAELAGMVAYCDFAEQTSVRDTEGRLKRPDMVVKLPNECVIAVDAKCNIDPYVRAVDTSDEQEREQLLERFAHGIAEQAKKLAAKSYWSDYEGGAEFVVMFVPGDQFLDAALARRSDLLEIAAQQGVILASPATLIGLLRAVAVGWAEQRLAEEARELRKLGSELHERASVALDHAAKLGQTIDRAVRQYNQFMGSVDSRLMPTLRKFEEAGAASGKSLPDPAEIEVRPKLLNHANAEED